MNQTTPLATTPRTLTFTVLSVLLLAGSGCQPPVPTAPSSNTTQGPAPVESTASTHDSGKLKVLQGHGQVIFLTEDRHVIRVEPTEQAKPQDISQALDKISKGKDSAISMSSDGQWLLLTSTRFGCKRWECASVVRSNLSEGQAVKAAGTVVHPDGPAAISRGAISIVYSSRREDGSGHDRDLFSVHKTPEGYGKPVLITGDSTQPFNTQPAISPDGKWVAFDCGPQPYASEGTGLCVVGMDGSGFREVLMPKKPPWGKKVRALHHPSFTPDGGVVVEIDSKGLGERIWRLATLDAKPTLVGKAFPNDNSPCALPDGRIVSLWLGRPAGPNKHELKLMDSTGKAYVMLATGLDIADVQLSCGEQPDGHEQL